MLLLEFTIQIYTKVVHICSQGFKLDISMYTRCFETTLHLQLMNLFNYIFNVLYFQIFNHTSCLKGNVLGYGVREANTIDVHKVTSQGDFLVFIKDFLVDIFSIVGYTFCILWFTVLSCKCGTVGPYISPAIPRYSRIIGRFCIMLLSTACITRFIA